MIRKAQEECDVARMILRGVVVLALLAAGWGAARAQTTAPDFEIVVSAPEGSTTIECVRGCSLAWVARGLNPNSQPMRSFSFACKGAERCSSSQVGGWIAP
jgi:hypothetical protein